MAPRSDEPRRRRRRRARPVRLDQRLEQALANVGIPEVGERVGKVVGQAISNAAHEIDRKIDHEQRRQERRAARATARARSENFSLLWGLLEIRRGELGEEHITVLWGLLQIRTRAPLRAEDVSEDADPETIARRRAERRMENLRSACIFGCLGAGFFYVSISSDTDFWAGVWGVASVSLLALGAGLCLAAFGERYRRRWVDEELGRVAPREESRRAGRDHARAMQELSASIAHEIRNPITAAKSLVQQMGEDPASGENVEYARVALEELGRVERSVSHLLRFARDEEVIFEDVRVAEVVGEVVGTLADRAKELCVEIETEIDSEGLVSGDPEKLRRVLLNLLGNALDALAGGGTTNPRVLLQTGDNLAGTEVWLRVRDNGPGIDAEKLGKIWNPFHTSKESGTGLGLAITKKVVEAHGGTVEVSSAPGRGTEFVVTLPKAQEGEGAA